jgi:hypothetical protein
MSTKTLPPNSTAAACAYSPGSVPAQPVVAENGVPPAGCYLCTWGFLRGQYVLRFMSAACPVHFRVPRAGAVEGVRGPRG